MSSTDVTRNAEVELTTMPGIVVGVDHSPAAAHAFAWAASRADRFGPVQAVLGWHNPWWYDLTARVILPEGPDREIIEAAHRLLDGLMEGTPPESVVTPAVVHGRPGEVLVAAAAAAELLVVGTRGHGPLTDPVVGSISAHCSTHAKGPVAIVPDGSVIDASPETIVVGVDGSEGSAAALDWALDYARLDDTVIACQTWEIPVMAGYEAIAMDAGVVAEAAADTLRASVEAACRRAGLPSSRVEQRVVEGDPRTVLRKQCQNGSILVVGRRGRSRIVRLLLGSVASSLVHRPLVPTVVVPMSHAAQAEA